MQKAIVPKVQLPGVSEELTNKLRYRIINRNRNLYSQWSVIGEIKRDREQVNFESSPSSFSTDNSISDTINVSWYTPDINQEFDIYVKYVSRQLNMLTEEFIFFKSLTQFLGRKNINSISINKPPPPSDRVFINPPSIHAAQVMIKLPEYPRIPSVPINILSFERASNNYVYDLERDPTFEVGDYVDIVLLNAPGEDNSEFTGIKKVSSIGPKTFSVASTGPDIATRNAPSSSTPGQNIVSKVNGIVQIVTNDILFT